MSFKVVIPARLASTRLPRKVLCPIAGRPMLAHVVRAALASRAEAVVVATDSEEVADAARTAGATVGFTRSDHRCGTDRIAELVEAAGWDDDTVVVNVQADEPLMPSALIDQVGGALRASSTAAIATACTPIEQAQDFVNPNIVKVVATPHGRALYFSRAPIPFHRDSTNQVFAGVARRHLGIYAYRAAALVQFAAAPPGVLEQHESLEQLRAFELGLAIDVVQATVLPGPGVDTLEDLDLVAARLQQQEDNRS